MKIQNIEQIDRLLPKRLIDRDIYPEIRNDLKKREIQLIYGPRQVGKSVLMYKLMQDVYKGDTDVYYYNFDDLGSEEGEFTSAEVFISSILSQKTNPDAQTYVFMDEVQRKKDIGLFLKYIYDQRQEIKFVLTGSTSLNIKSMVKEPLTGRKFEYHLYPLSLKEIFSYKKINLEQVSVVTPTISDIQQEYMVFGGYPEMFLAESMEEKVRKLQEISSSYITRDLSNTFGLSENSGLLECTTFLAQNISNLLSKEKISNTLGLTSYKVNSFIDILSKSFVIDLVKPYYRDPVKEISHQPKVYFVDNGIRNILIGNVSASFISVESGKVFEQTVFQTLRSKYHGDIRYWRNKNQTEVDFIVAKQNKILAYESKLTWTGVNPPRSYESFKNNYSDIDVVGGVVTKDNLYDLIKS